jgi:type III restriction enzyme
LLYQLNPVKAYDLGLVKQIEVDSIYAEHSHNQAFIRLESFYSTKTKVTAKIIIEAHTPKGVTRKSVTVNVGDDLYLLSNQREIYKDGYLITGLDARSECIELANGDMIFRGETRGGLQDEIMKVQLQKAIEEHFKKEKRYQAKGIKVLSLFFIDRVANYRHYDEQGQPLPGKFAAWFEQIYTELAHKPAYQGVIPFPVTSVHNGYFAQDKKGKFKDSREDRPTQADDDTYQLIMRDKERLLDANEPLRFIFSHSALREGWDSPNVFQICTLNETKSELKKRQEIGRGLRLAVDQAGNRVQDRGINILTVVANESYEDFARQLQKEIKEECGVEFTGRIKRKEDRVKVTLRKGFETDEKFLDLWNRIKHKTMYQVRYDTDTLIRQAAQAIKKLPEIKQPVIRSERTTVGLIREGLVGYQTGFGIHQVEPTFTTLPDMIGYIQNKTELTRSTLLEILQQSTRLPDVLKNPQLFLDTVVKEIQHVLHQLMIDGIKYTKIGDQTYTMEVFESAEIEHYLDNLYQVTQAGKTIANYLVIDSMSTPEREFAEDCENNEEVEFYFKLPRRFKIDTPIGPYTPDWALIFKNEQKFYFVTETKSTLDRAARRDPENMKIDCGRAHFAEFEDVEFRDVTKLSDLAS